MEPLTTIASAAATEIGKAAEKDAEKFLKLLLGEPIKAIGGMLTDKVNARRHRNLVLTVLKAKQQLQSAGISPKEVPLTIIHSALESASLEEDPDLQTTWANLLANAADPRQTKPVLPSFSAMLRELTPRDVKFLAALYSSSGKALEERKRSVSRSALSDIEWTEADLRRIYTDAGLSRTKKLRDRHPAMRRPRVADSDTADLMADMQDFEITLNVSLRGGILAQEQRSEPIHIGKYMERNPLTSSSLIEIDYDVLYSLSPLGIAFVAACEPVKCKAEREPTV